MPGSLPPDILVRPAVPHSVLFPKARCVVHHGGIGTTSQAFEAGVPQLVLPFAHDQFDNAARVQDLGCGLRRGMPVTEAGLRDAPVRLLSGDGFARGARALRGRAGSGQAGERALAVIRSLAQRGERPR